VLHRRGFAGITGKGGERRTITLGSWRWVALGYALFVGALSVYLPYLTIGQAAFAQAWGRGFSLENITLRNFRYLLFEYPITQQSIIHTLAYSGLAASFCVALGFTTAYLVVRRLVRGTAGLASLAMAPLVIPGIVLGIAFYALYAPPPLALNGTALIVVLAYIGRFLPIAYANGSAAVQGVGSELEDAGRMLGAARWTTVARIVVPLLKRPLLGSWLLVFIPAARELSTALFVVGPRTRVLSILMLDLNEEGNFEVLAAAGCILLVIMVASAAIGMRAVGRDFMLRPR
jgi:iron(III) transport system permease protein